MAHNKKKGFVCMYKSKDFSHYKELETMYVCNVYYPESNLSWKLKGHFVKYFIL